MAQHKLLFKTDDFTEHDIISDGRCFSGAAYYVLVLQGTPRAKSFNPRNGGNPADSVALNLWIQNNIINPILGIGRDPTNKNFVSYMDWVYDYNLFPDTSVETFDVDPKLEAALNVCFELSDFGSGNIHNLLNSASHDLDTLGFINVDSDVLLGIFKVSNAKKITREMINNKKQENALRITEKACFKRYEKNYLDYIKNLASKGWTEPHYGPAQVLSDEYKKNVIVLVDHSGDLTPAFMTSPENKTENNVYIKTGFYMFEGKKYGAGHFYALELKDRTTEIRAKQLAVEASRKDIEDVIRTRASKKKKAAAGIAASREPAKPTVSSDPQPGSKEAADLATATAASLESAKPKVSSSEDAELAAVMEKSRKKAEALKKKEEEDLKKGLVESAKPKVPVVPTTTSGPLPLKCPKPKTKIPIYYVVFTGPNQLGDYNYMIKQPEYKNTLFIFNDNRVSHYSYFKGSGNAVIRPYNIYGFKAKSKDRPVWAGMDKPLSAGIPTGDGKSLDKGYNILNKDTLFQIDRAIDDIRSAYLTNFTYNRIIYSGTNNQTPGFQNDPEDLLGIGIYDVSKNVREYITQQIKCLGDFRGKLEKEQPSTTTPLKSIKNAAIMLFVNNSANVVFVKDTNTHKWMLPGGKIDATESPWAAAVREFNEETGEKLPANLKEENFKPYDYKHNINYTRIFIGKTKTNCPIFNEANIHNKETDKLECRLLSDVIAHRDDYSGNIWNSTNVIYKLINDNYENFKNYATQENPGKTNAVTSQNVTAPQSTITTAPSNAAAPALKKNVTFSPISETRSTPNKYVQESKNNNNNNIADGNQYVSAKNKVEHGYVMAANRINKYNDAPFTSNPKRHIAMGTGAGLAVLAGLTFVGGGRKETRTRKKQKNERTGTRKHLRKKYKSSGFSLNKRQKVKKCFKTQKRRR